jgi:glycosyltransferase involved in cell wall biosynthesis
MMWLRGAREVTWQDGHEEVTRHLLLPPVHEIVKGLVSNLRTVTRALAAVREAETVRPATVQWSQRLNRALYLRTDHWFGLTGGGSVAHTSGVINGMRACDIEVSILSTDRLTGLDDTGLSVLAPAYADRAIVQGAAELAYNDTLMAALVPQLVSRPDFIYQRLSYMNYAGALARLDHRIPYVCEFNGPLRWVGKHWGGGIGLLGGLGERIETLCLKAADLIVVVSEPVRDLVLARGVPTERILVNPNGVDETIYRPEIDASGLREKLGLTGKIVIGFIGTFGEWHGADRLAAAYVRLRSQRPDLGNNIHLLMIGDGPTRARTEAIVTEAGAGGTATFPGAVPQAQGPIYLAATDILVSPHVPNPDGSRFFGSPTKLFEYMAMGRGIVASDLDQIGKVLAHDKTAWLVTPGGVPELTSGLERLIDHKPLRDRLGLAAREEAVRRYTWRAHVRCILDALNAAAGRC